MTATGIRHQTSAPTRVLASLEEWARRTYTREERVEIQAHVDRLDDLGGNGVDEDHFTYVTWLLRQHIDRRRAGLYAEEDAARAEEAREARAGRRQFSAAEALAIADVPCRYCGSTDRVVLDHIVPLAKGGPDEPHNLQPLCTPCNSAKGAKLR